MNCPNCGYEGTQTGPHQGGTATCVRGPKCELCGMKYGSSDRNAHDFSAWQSIGSGSHRQACRLCGSGGNVIGPCSGGAATCTKRAVCSACNGEYGDLAAHSFTGKASDKQASPATCTAAATYYVQCDNCDAVSETDTVAVGEPLKHDFAWQSNGDGTHTWACQREGCGYTEGDPQPCSGGTATAQSPAICAYCGYAYAPALQEYTYKIHYDAAPGNGYWQRNTKSTETSVDLDMTMNFAEGQGPSLAGHRFTGQWKDSNGNIYENGDTVHLTAENPTIWLYAQYEKIETTCDREGHD